jgi:rhomboid protease GluP
VDPHDPYAARVADPYARPRPAAPARPVDPENLVATTAAASAEAPLELGAHMLAEAPPQRFDFERGMSRWPPVTLVIIALLAVVFFLEVVGGALESKEAIMRAGALERQAVARGEWWRIPASMHLHGSFEHLFGNCCGLFLLGLAIEHAYGPIPATAMYFLAGFAGAILSLAFEGGPTVGASGAIFGWWGAAVVFYYRYRSKLLDRDTRVGFVLLVWAAWTIFTGFLSPEISNFSHLGGFLAGAGMAFFIPTRLAELRELQTTNA